MSSTTDMEILRRAREREQGGNGHLPGSRSWEYHNVGASRSDMRRLVDDGLVCVSMKSEGTTRYRLTDKGLAVLTSVDCEAERVPASSVLEAMDLVVGFEDLKATLAQAVSSGKRINFLLEGPPACAKSIMLEAVRSAVPRAYLAFGSRTSASGLSDALFEQQPAVLLILLLSFRCNFAEFIIEVEHTTGSGRQKGD